MRVYIDKANASHFSSVEKTEQYEMCMRLLKRNCDLYFSFPKNDLLVDERLLKWYKQFTTGVRGEIIYNENEFPERPIKTNFIRDCSFEQLTAVYLLTDEKAHLLNHKILFANNHNDLDLLTLLYTDQDGELTRSIRVKNVASWADLLQPNLPLTDIIITDPFIFFSPELLQYNLYSLLSQMVSPLKDTQTKINIVILTLPKNKNEKEKEPDFAIIKAEIKKTIKRIVGVEPNVTFVLSSGKDKHDRIMITNYVSYDSGDSFNFFNSKQELITKGDTWHINSHGKIENLKNTHELLNDIQNIINRVKRLNNPELLIGDKVCNFLQI